MVFLLPNSRQLLYYNYKNINFVVLTALQKPMGDMRRAADIIKQSVTWRYILDSLKSRKFLRISRGYSNGSRHMGMNYSLEILYMVF